MKKTCTGGVWRKSSTTGTSDAVYQMEGIHRGLLGYLESGLACLVCSLRVLWYGFLFVYAARLSVSLGKTVTLSPSFFEKCQNILIQLFSFSPHVVLILQMTVTS